MIEQIGETTHNGLEEMRKAEAIEKAIQETKGSFWAILRSMRLSATSDKQIVERLGKFALDVDIDLERLEK